MSKVQKNVYTVTFRHTKHENEPKTEMSVVAGDFDEALKKARENEGIVQSGKDDPVEIVAIELSVVIDVE